MSEFYTDEIILVDTTTDKNGVKTEHESAIQNARVEDFNRLITDSNGQEVWSDIIIFTETESISKYTDKVIIKKKAGVVFNQPNKKWLIKKMPIIHSFVVHHKEIYV